MTDETKVSWLQRLKNGLKRSSDKLVGGIADLFTKRKLDDDALQDLEDLLITADLGVATSAKLVAALAGSRFEKEVDAEEVQTALADEVAKVLEPVAKPLEIQPTHTPHVVLVCGVNGSGKTTTIGKLAQQYRNLGSIGESQGAVIPDSCRYFRPGGNVIIRKYFFPVKQHFNCRFYRIAFYIDL